MRVSAKVRETVSDATGPRWTPKDREHSWRSVAGPHRAVVPRGPVRAADRRHQCRRVLRKSSDEALQTLAVRGPSELIRQNRDAERSDPTCERWPRGKVYDNGTGVAVTRRPPVHRI